MKKNWRANLLDGICILIGSPLTAFGLAVFTAPNHIAPGGVSGIATSLSFITGLPIGVLTLVFNIPLLMIAWRGLGFPSLIKTIAAILLLSLGIDLFMIFIPPYTSNALLASLTGGVITGTGLGILLARGISTGGTDLISMMLVKKNLPLSTGQLLMVIDTLVVAFALIVFQNLEIALYSILAIFISSKCIDVIQQGVDHAKVIYIVTDKAEALLSHFAGEMGRGVTVLPARGGFTGMDKSVLMMITRRGEISATLQAIRMLDNAAFTILSDATAVHGEGFKGYE